VILPDIIIPGLDHPKGIGVDASNHLLYVASQGNNTLYQYDPILGWVLRAIATGSQPFGVGVNSMTHKVYVANFAGDSLTVINGNTGLVVRTISFVPYGEPTYVAVNPVTNRVYVPLHEGGRLAVIDGATDTLLTTLDVGGGGAFGVAVDPLLNRVYVSCRDAQIVRVIDGATNSILWHQTAYPGGMPYALGIDPGLGQLYVSFAPDPGDPNQPNQVLVYRIPASGPSLLSTVHVGNGGATGGGGIAANTVTHHVFVTNSQEDSVSVFDGVTLMLITTTPVGDDPLCVAVDPSLSYAFVGNRGSDSVTGIPDVY
jgi:YVTN family beta-propeller protein